MTRLRRYHAAVWDEPLVMELAQEGRRGMLVPAAEAAVQERVGDAASLIPDGMRRDGRRRCRSCPSPTCSVTTCTSPRRRWG